MASESTNLVKVTYVKSVIGYSQRQKDTVKSLGLRHIGDTAVHADSAPIRGMLRAVSHLVSSEPIDQVDCLFSAHLELAHVADVEESGCFANRHVLGNRPGVLHRELPSGELDHAGAERLMGLIQRGFLDHIESDTLR